MTLPSEARGVPTITTCQCFVQSIVIRYMRLGFFSFFLRLRFNEIHLNISPRSLTHRFCKCKQYPIELHSVGVLILFFSP